MDSRGVYGEGKEENNKNAILERELVDLVDKIRLGD